MATFDVFSSFSRMTYSLNALSHLHLLLVYLNFEVTLCLGLYMGSRPCWGMGGGGLAWLGIYIYMIGKIHANTLVLCILFNFWFAFALKLYQLASVGSTVFVFLSTFCILLFFVWACVLSRIIIL